MTFVYGLHERTGDRKTNLPVQYYKITGNGSQYPLIPVSIRAVFSREKEKNRKRKRGFSKETECLEMFRSESVPIGCKCRKLNDLRKIERKSPDFSEEFEKK